MSDYNFTIKANGQRWNIAVDPAASYGYYEPSSGVEGGGLWFEGKALVDFDGRYGLPREVCTLLQAQGFTVDEDFFPDVPNPYRERGVEDRTRPIIEQFPGVNPQDIADNPERVF